MVDESFAKEVYRVEIVRLENGVACKENWSIDGRIIESMGRAMISYRCPVSGARNL